jgi:hypothetical protein
MQGRWADGESRRVGAGMQALHSVGRAAEVFERVCVYRIAKGNVPWACSFFLRVKQPGQPDRQPSALGLKHATLA